MVIKGHNREQNINISNKRSIIPAEENNLSYAKRKKNHNSRVRTKRIVSNVRKNTSATVRKTVAEGEAAGNNSRQNSTDKEINNAKKLINYAVADTKQFVHTTRRALSKRQVRDKDKADDTEYSGNREDKGDSEYQGKRTSIKKKIKTTSVAGVIFLKVMAMLKAVISAMSNIVVISVVAVVVVVTVTVAVLQNATYDFVVDEEYHVRELMSNITYDFSQEIENKKIENECDVVVSSGQLADWKEIVALWWTLKTHVSESENWENYFTADDQEDLKYLFYQFNHVEYSVSETSSDDENVDSKKILRVNITNTSLEELVEHWGLDDDQIKYLNSLLADEEIWNEILGTTELSRIAYGEIGNGALKYQQWCGDETIEKSSAFVAYCLGQVGLISDKYIQISTTAEEFKEQMVDKGFLKYKGLFEPEEGDIVFLNVNGELRTGIITRIDDMEVLYVTICGYAGNTTVEEVVIGKTSGIIDSYADLGSYFVLGLNNNQGAENVIRVALQFEGVTDDGNNNVIFNTDYYGHEVSGDNYQWCCVFVWDVFRMAGCSEAFYNGGKTAGCEEVQAWGRREELILPLEMAQPGDLILFDWEPNGIPNHIGILYNINSNGTIQTIEGNTGFGNNSNGGQVMVRTRDPASVICVIRPKY
ncbi:MAG: CHAP domain-containing protein [Lachnospiraceae bacterium]|nr:CHAP domain-containing protein [Lachnospiraceae bacterium]